MLVCLLLAFPLQQPDAAVWPQFRESAWFGERVREVWLEDSVRAVLNAPERFDPRLPTQLIVFATPNGNSIEQSLGCRTAEGLDWHYDIQHVAAQVRYWRSLQPAANVVLAVVEAEGLSWPAWRKSHPEAPAAVRRIVATLRGWIPDESEVTLACHSGGGAFLWSFLDGGDGVPDWVDRMVFLDANYSFDDELRHGDKLLDWLRTDDRRRLIVIAYDDRDITLNGKKVIGPTGGTFRATERMRLRFSQDEPLTDSATGPFRTTRALNGRISLHVHPNPENKILHTALVGEMNGLVAALADGHSVEWGTFGGPRAYAAFIQPPPGIPPRPAGAQGGAALMQRIDKLSLSERESVLSAEILRGNLPEFLRRWQTIELQATDHAGVKHAARCQVLPDYLAVGSDDDFVRVPLTPHTAERIAEAFGAALPTRQLVNEIARQAKVRLQPQPLTEARAAVATFVQHQRLIEEQFGARPRGELVAGHKKDVVVSNRLDERPQRLALYGWHDPDGKPIQPLTIVHVDWYVDYSHGIRLVHRTVVVDGQPRDLHHVLHDGKLHPLVSDEGPIRRPTY